VEAKYLLKVYEREKALRIPKEAKTELKGLPVGRKLMAKMKREVVYCPLRRKEVPFLVCFTCPNFISRVRGEIRCAGLPLTS